MSLVGLLDLLVHDEILVKTVGWQERIFWKFWLNRKLLSVTKPIFCHLELYATNCQVKSSYCE